jgi:hypothetical protein
LLVGHSLPQLCLVSKLLLRLLHPFLRRGLNERSSSTRCPLRPNLDYLSRYARVLERLKSQNRRQRSSEGFRCTKRNHPGICGRRPTVSFHTCPHISVSISMRGAPARRAARQRKSREGKTSTSVCHDDHRDWWCMRTRNRLSAHNVHVDVTQIPQNKI